MRVRCKCCGQFVDAADLDAAIAQLRLPRKMQRIFDLLVARDGHRISKTRIVDAVYGDDPEGGPDCAEQTIESHIHHLRRKIAPLGITIDAVRHEGYRLELGRRFTRPSLKPATRVQGFSERRPC